MNHIDYVEAGMRVFGLHRIMQDGTCACDDPNCEAIGKHPRTSNWQFTPIWSDEQLDLMEITGHFATGFGVLCDGYLIIDVDPRNGGFESYAKLEKDTGLNFKDLSGFVVATGGGGWHIYFKNTSTLKLRKNLEQYKGIDFKSNGFVVGCNSIHATGAIYECDKGSPDEITDAPKELLELLEKPEFVSTSRCDSDVDVEELLNYIDPDCEYEQWVQVGMAVHHATEGSGFDVWNDWSAKGSKYNKDEMDHKWHSFGKSANPVTAGTLVKIAKDNGYIESVTFVTDLVEDEEPSGENETNEPVNINAIDTSTAPGVLGDVIDFINANSRYPRERLAVGAAISTLGNIAGLRWRDADYGATTNTFVFCVAGSATGKEAIQDAQKQLHAAIGLTPATYGKIKSEQEIVRNLIEHQMSAYIIDELGIFLQKLENASTKGSSSYLEGVIGELMAVYSKADSTYLLSGDVQKEVIKKLNDEINFNQKQIDNNENIELATKRLKSAVERVAQVQSQGIIAPFMSMIGFTTPVTFNGLVTYQAATNGFIGRALLFEEKDNSPRSKRGFSKPSISVPLKMQLQAIAHAGNASFEPQLRIEHHGEHSYVLTDGSAKKLLDDILTYLEDYADYHEETTGLEAIVNRAFEQILKISLIVAIGDGGIRKVEHVRWAYALVKRDIDNKINLASGNIANTSKHKSEEIISKVRHALDKNTPITLGAIANRYRSMNKEHIEQCLEFLESKGDARREESPSGRGRPTTKWYAA